MESETDNQSPVPSPAQQPAGQPSPSPTPPSQAPSAAPVPEPLAKVQADDLHSMVVLQPGETIVCDIKRHPFGILSLYMTAGLGIAVLLILAAIFVPKLSDNSLLGGVNVQPIAYAVVGLLTLGGALIVAVASRVYWQNRWIVTSDSVTQITQNSLFGRQSSQLSLGNLEDVTVDQAGIVQHMFNFGTLRVETAGERSKFAFPYCPNPTEYARRILIARENFMNHHQYEEGDPSVHFNG